MALAEHVSSGTGAINAGYRGRVRTGCLTCRASKVRCDEQHPVCKRCTRLGRACVYKKKASSQHSSPSDTIDHGGTTTDAHGPRLRLRRVSVTPSPLQDHAVEDQQPVDVASPYVGTPRSNSQHDGRSPYLLSTTTTDSPSLLSMMVSQDIYLCTTIDLMVANEESARPSFTYFQHSVFSPFIAPYDPIGWQYFQHQVVSLAAHNATIATALLAVQSLYKAQGNGLSTSKALSLYRAASSLFQAMLSREDEYDPETILMLILLLHLAEMLLPEDTGPGPLAQHDGPLLTRLELWSEGRHHTPLAVRVASWLLLCHAAARRGGNSGLLSNRAQNVLRLPCCNTPTLPLLPLDPTTPLHTTMLQSLTEPLYNFHFQLQLLSSQVADLSHYHRSRVTSSDQEEVFALIASLKSQMQRLWTTRPATMRSPPAEIRSHLSQHLSEPLLHLIATCTAAYHHEIVEVGRNLSDPPFASPEARDHLASVRALIESPDWPTTSPSTASNDDDDAATSGKLHAAFLRPLFLYAIESIHQAETEWAVEQMRRIKDPVSRSDFFASFADGLARAQREKGRRVTTKWWCWQAFGVTPPYL
ncbi:uncharacterized protein HMPREF1541_10666 [Cyphellophora europaea CBS 101466]|uniref:Zn(2)-C6 fungal-type domain-containing protein n=1 Tax=Cyphellophora europaea (strain CBS 101466) TaxID=1220924 RepID=W2S5X5_CYPE1|nr:uncharacterized protein HMPREF1541_10666 [Cyphellophora europaea CBS 101466]ETN44116.1 hypothetical protein HMPREF1541_10666 [Cyphellophora europaea CBS 101466]